MWDEAACLMNVYQTVMCGGCIKGVLRLLQYMSHVLLVLWPGTVTAAQL